ncbi:MAG TPA: response regulator [Nitrospiria bacterium]|nr:response regulator [Nitrospiria bacterium]
MRVLLVEDDPGVVYYMERGFMRQGHEVVSVNSGRFAAKVSKESLFDLVVLEADLAREDGFEVCRMMRRQQIGTPILLMTHDSLPGSLAKTVEVGATGQLTKPFSFEDLLKKASKMTAKPRVSTLPRDGDHQLRKAAV